MAKTVCSQLTAGLVEFFIFFAWICLEVTNVILHIFWGISDLFKMCMGALMPKKKEKHVVIVGASFGGLAAQRELSGRPGLKVTLIDFKEYFEYTPGVLRCMVQPSWHKELICPLPSSRNEVVNATMTGATSTAVVLKDSKGAERQLPFDYLVMAVGSTYAEPIKPVMSEATLAARTATLATAAAKLAAASKVIVIGAGPVGVELVGEILTVYPNKHVVVVDFANTILPGFDKAASDYTFAWLEDAGVELMLGEAIDKIEEQAILLKSGKTVSADVVYKCVGVMPNTSMLKGTPYAGTGFRDSVEVNDYLQVAGHPTVYCVGDMMSHASRELKLGHTAEVNAHLVAHNIVADVAGDPLLTYPNGVTGADWTPKIWCLSLGKYSACAGFNGLVLSGWYVAVIKWMLEWTKVAAAAERPVGIFFWWFADNFSNWLSRTILIPPERKGAGDTKDEGSCLCNFLLLKWLEDYSCFADLGMLLLRVISASLIVHHGIDKLQHVEGFSTNVIAGYFPFLPGPPEFWTYLSAGFEVVGTFCFVVGLFVRHAAGLLAGTMVVATAFQLMSQGFQNYPFGLPPSGPAYTFEPALAFLAVNTHILFAGPGKFAVQPHFPSLEFLKAHSHPLLNLVKDPIFADLSMLLLRVVSASLIVHHGFDKLQHVEGFSTNVIAGYFPFLPGPPEFWTYLSAGFEVVGTFCFVVGLFVRHAAGLLAGTMVVATAFQLMSQGFQNYPFGLPPSGPAYTFEPALAFLGVTGYIATVGPGRFGLYTPFSSRPILPDADAFTSKKVHPSSGSPGALL